MGKYLGASVGASVDYNYRQINYDIFQFDRQWNGDIFDVNRSNSETFGSESHNYWGYSVGAGARLRNPRYRSFLNVSLSAHFKSQAFNRGFYLGDANTQTGDRLISILESAVEIPGSQFDFLVNQQFQFQAPYYEYVLQIGSQYHISEKKGEELAVGLTGGIRVGDAIISAIHVKYQSWQASLSYDINISEFSAATNGQGGIELSIIRIVTHPDPPRTFKVCPVF